METRSQLLPPQGSGGTRLPAASTWEATAWGFGIGVVFCLNAFFLLAVKVGGLGFKVSALTLGQSRRGMWFGV